MQNFSLDKIKSSKFTMLQFNICFYYISKEISKTGLQFKIFS